MRGAHWGGHREGGTEIFEGGTCPHVPPPSDAPGYYLPILKFDCSVLYSFN